MSTNQTRLFFGKPIPIDEKVSVLQPKMSQIIEMGETYEKYLIPFTITLETIFDDEEIISKLNLFEMLFEKTSETKEYVLSKVFDDNPIELISNSINFFTGEEVKVLENRKKFVIGDSYILDKTNFSSFRKIIQAVVNRKDVVVEKMPKNLDERRMDIWKKIHEGRRRKAEKEAVKIEDMANSISFGGKSYISLEQIMDMTYYQFINAYKSIMNVDAFYVGLQYKVSQKYEYKDELPHWSKELKVSTELD